MRHFRWQTPRGLVVLVAGLITLLLGFVVTRAIVREVGTLLEILPQYAEAFKNWLASVVSNYPGVFDADLQTWVAINAQAALGGLTVELTGALVFVGFATSLFGGFLTILLTVLWRST